jgi:hypothetical protein
MFTHNLRIAAFGVTLISTAVAVAASESPNGAPAIGMVEEVPSEASVASPAMPVVLPSFGPTFAGAVASGGTSAFAVRVTNRGRVAGQATVTLLSAASGAVLGVWTSPSIPSFGGIQNTLADIAAHATPALTSAQMAQPMNVHVRTTFPSATQMVALNSQTGALSNLTACGARLFEDIALLGYVEGPGTNGITSAVRVVNASATATSQAHLTLYNAATGVSLGTWTSPNVPPNGSVTMSTSAIVAAATPAVPANVVAFTIVASPTRNLRLEHMVLANGTLGDLTNACG